MEYILYVAVVILLVWIASINNRVSKLEKNKHTATSAAPAQPFAAPLAPGLAPRFSAETGLPLNAGGIAASGISANGIPAAGQSLHASALASAKRNSEMETEIGANWLSRIGILALVIGIAFFFKYAVDQGWINASTRIVIGFIIGALLVLLGELWKEKYRTYAQILSTGGIAIAYFSVFAAYNFYHLFSQPLAFGLMVAIAVIAVLLSYRYQSIALEVIGFIGAYSASAVAPAGTDNHTFLFTYLSILNIATVAMLLRKYAVEAMYLSFVGTILNFAGWGSGYLSVGTTLPSLIFLVITLFVWIIGSVALLRYHYHYHREGLDDNIGTFTAIFQALAIVFYFFSILIVAGSTAVQNYQPLMAFWGAIILLFGYISLLDLPYAANKYCLSLGAVGLGAFGIAREFKGMLADVLVIILAAASASLGGLYKRIELRIGSVFLLIAAFFAVIAEPYDPSTYAFLFNAKFGLMFLEAAAFYFVAWVYRISERSEFEKNMHNALEVMAVIFLWFAVSWEIVYYFRDSASANIRNLVLGIWWIGYALVIMVVGALSKNSVFRKLAIVLFGASILKVFLFDVSTLDTGYRVVSFIVLGVILLAVSFAYQRNKERIQNFLEPRVK